MSSLVPPDTMMTADVKVSADSDRHEEPASTQTHALSDTKEPGSLRPANPASKRFSLMRFRHFSDTQLFTKARLQAAADHHDATNTQSRPSQRQLDPPAIVMTAPAADPASASAPTPAPAPEKRNRKSQFLSLRRQSSRFPILNPSTDSSDDARTTILPWRKSSDQPRSTQGSGLVPSSLAPHHHHSASHLSLPHTNLADTDTSLRPASARTSPRRLFKSNKRKSLFPLPPKIATPPLTAPVTPRASMSALSAHGLHDDPTAPKLSLDTTLAVNADGNGNNRARSAVSFAAPEFPLLRNASSHSAPSRSPPPTAQNARLTTRDRASTTSTFPRISDDTTPPPTIAGSGRNSISNSGRTSRGGLFTFSRFRHGSESNSSRHGSPGPNSKSNSFAISRDLQPPPPREGSETAAVYLERMRDTMPRSVIAATLSQSDDPFYQAVLRSYNRKLALFGEPIDMSLRKFLLEAELPKETVHVDRVIQAFADRYHECNPGIFMSPDEAYVIAFSLMILHTDAFNKSNKHKMSKEDYIKNTRGQHVAEEILACFYENICYTPFIHFDEDDYEASTDRLSAIRSRKLKLKNSSRDPANKANGPVDPYSLIIESKLDLLRPSIKESINLDDPYTYLGTLKSLNSAHIQSAIVNTGILEIISARSRPAAFETQATRDNPEESRPGVVQIQVTKVGTLWRKSAKKKKARSPWQEWGAVLTGSQLYFFRNLNWVKMLMHQYQSHRKAGHTSPVIFKPSLEDFKPDDLTKTDDTVALLDRSYNKHKNAFQLLRTGGEEEVFLADTEADLNEWISLINYTATFRYAGVTVRGFLDGRALGMQQSRIMRINSTATTATIHSTRSHSQSEPPRTNAPNSHTTLQVMAARRKIMIVRIAEAEIALTHMNANLDAMLRNARHLQLLAPVQPRTRDVVIHAAARMDAMLKWSRREIWRTRCYKDILSMDALEDSEDIITESAKIRPPSGMLLKHDAARQLSATDDSKPVAPQTPNVSAGLHKLSTTDSPVKADEIFKTPPENHQHIQSLSRGSWGSIANTSPSPNRPQSFASTTPSTASAQRASETHISSTSSVHDFDSLATSPALTGGRAALRTPLSTVKNPDPSASSPSQARSTTSSLGRQVSEMTGVTPESVTGKARHRTSLHRSFRDTPPELTSQRHRRARDSASTIKSDVANGDRNDDATTSLERGKGSFIVHGKQASVITFGGDWADDKMRIRRESDRGSKTLGETTPLGEPASHDPHVMEAYIQSTHDASLSGVASPDSETMSGGREFFDAPDFLQDQTRSAGTVEGSRASPRMTNGPSERVYLDLVAHDDDGGHDSMIKDERHVPASSA